VTLVAAVHVASAEQRQWPGIFNGGFEQGLHRDGSRPAHWVIGFPGDDAEAPDAWRLVFDRTIDSRVVEIICRKPEQACLISQVADLPVRSMAGRRLTLTARMRTESAVAVAGVQLIALNPEVAPDPLIGVPHVGFLDLQPRGSGWVELSGEVEQERFLRRASADLTAHPTVAAVLYSLHVQTYLGAAPFFQEASRHVGLFGHDGAPKRSWQLPRSTRAVSGTANRAADPGPWCVHPPRRGRGVAGR
jgi:hypothetical protein